MMLLSTAEGVMAEYRIDDLARAADVTSRNVRAYQGQGLLPAPRREGRIALYGDAHLARLRLIKSLLERGYSLAQIAELIAAWEQGRHLADVLGIEEVLASPFGDDRPEPMTAEELHRILEPDLVPRAVHLGIVRAEGEGFVLLRSGLLQSLSRAVDLGIPIEVALSVHERIAPKFDEISELLVQTAITSLTNEIGPSYVPSDAELAALVPALGELKSIAMQSMHSEMARALEDAVSHGLSLFFNELADSVGAEAAALTRRQG